MDEFEARAYILNKGKDIKTIEELCDLIKEVEEKFNYDYGVAPRSIGAVAAVVANYLSREMGITGFQAGCAMFDFIRGYIKTNNKCGLKLVDFDDMLYPQYDHKFAKTISSHAWKSIQKEAKERLAEKNHTHPAVREHWESIVKGEIPFGYVISDD